MTFSLRGHTTMSTTAADGGVSPVWRQVKRLNRQNWCVSRSSWNDLWGYSGKCGAEGGSYVSTPIYLLQEWAMTSKAVHNERTGKGIVSLTSIPHTKPQPPGGRSLMAEGFIFPLWFWLSNPATITLFRNTNSSFFSSKFCSLWLDGKLWMKRAVWGLIATPLLEFWV